jgi:hypothetical protein
LNGVKDTIVLIGGTTNGLTVGGCSKTLNSILAELAFHRQWLMTRVELWRIHPKAYNAPFAALTRALSTP